MKKPSNFLECKGAAIALCYYSGPGPTTPCNPDGLGLANCTCYEIPGGHPYLVDINAILNRDVYLKTVAACGKEGQLCRPIGPTQAPVCEAINNNTLIPGADLISTFSLYLEKQFVTEKEKEFSIVPTPCPTASYAGCMTAPCKRTGKIDPKTRLPLVQCGCPTYTGPYQVGTAIDQDQCVLGGNYVWSAAYNVPSPPPPPPPPAVFFLGWGFCGVWVGVNNHGGGVFGFSAFLVAERRYNFFGENFCFHQPQRSIHLMIKMRTNRGRMEDPAMPIY